MKLAERDPLNLKRAQYSSRMTPSSGSSSSRSIPKKLVGAEPTRDVNMYYPNNAMNEIDVKNLNGLIMQSSKGPAALQFNPNDLNKHNLISNINVK